MSQQSDLTADMKKAIHERAVLLSCIVCEAENLGASTEVIERHLTEEVDAMRSALSEHYPLDYVEAVVGELIDTYQAELASLTGLRLKRAPYWTNAHVSPSQKNCVGRKQLS